jgi:hypothetical protein
VVLRLKTGETQVPLRGTVLAKSKGVVRFRMAGGWEIGVYKSFILDFVCEKEFAEYTIERAPVKAFQTWENIERFNYSAIVC